MRTRQILRNPMAFTGKLKDLPGFLAKMKTVIPITFSNI
ncbi:hypothetical protein FHS90_003019 [Rufibacter quisquiliarum]|uniref:Uncharacterized protein n=1 Tax=Rufibacter quisquiliarum TaxID=1549639 RepID=A0A839GKI8_9BACT|nr:hypothetical protein [Rufibacter quisquiliarum]